MKEEIAKRWVEELRSGRHQQGHENLLTETGAKCCLGVLALDVLGATEEEARQNFYLTPEWQDLAGLKSNQGKFKVGEATIHLAELNDAVMLEKPEHTFSDIADIIEKHWPDL